MHYVINVHLRGKHVFNTGESITDIHKAVGVVRELKAKLPDHTITLAVCWTIGIMMATDDVALEGYESGVIDIPTPQRTP